MYKHIRASLLSICIVLFFFSALIYADSNGVWTSSSDVRGGVFGSDEQDVTSFYSFVNPVNINSNLTINGYTKSQYYCDENGSNCKTIEELDNTNVNISGSGSGSSSGFDIIKGDFHVCDGTDIVSENCNPENVVAITCTRTGQDFFDSQPSISGTQIYVSSGRWAWWAESCTGPGGCISSSHGLHNCEQVLTYNPNDTVITGLEVPTCDSDQSLSFDGENFECTSVIQECDIANGVGIMIGGSCEAWRCDSGYSASENRTSCDIVMDMWQGQGLPGACGWSTSPWYCRGTTDGSNPFEPGCWQNVQNVGQCTQGVDCPASGDPWQVYGTCPS